MLAAPTRHDVREGALCNRKSCGFYVCVMHTCNHNSLWRIPHKPHDKVLRAHLGARELVPWCVFGGRGWEAVPLEAIVFNCTNTSDFALTWGRKYLDSTYQQNVLWTSPKLGPPARSSKMMAYHRLQKQCVCSAEQHSPADMHVVGEAISELDLGEQIRKMHRVKSSLPKKQWSVYRAFTRKKDCTGCFGDITSLGKPLR